MWPTVQLIISTDLIMWQCYFIGLLGIVILFYWGADFRDLVLEMTSVFVWLKKCWGKSGIWLGVS